MVKIRQLVMVVLLLAQGIFEVLKSVNNLEELEGQIQVLVQKAAGMLLVEALQEIDKKLGSQRDSAELKNIGMKLRTIITGFGEITYRRRMYQNKKAKKYHFLLDEAMGIEEHRRLNPRMEKLSVELGTEMPFRRAAKILGYIVPEVNAMTVWKVVQKAGEEAVEEAKAVRDAVFKKGAVPRGGKAIKDLFIEADGVLVRQQKTKKRHQEIKLVVAYEGKEGSRRNLVNRRTVAGVVDGESIWEEASTVFAHKWDLGRVEKVRVGGDGARWTPAGTDRMARLPAARANGELGNYTEVSKNPQHRWEILKQVMSDTAIEPQAKVTEKDLEAWLEAAVPALRGPFADKPWIKYVLRTITSIQRITA